MILREGTFLGKVELTRFKEGGLRRENLKMERETLHTRSHAPPDIRKGGPDVDHLGSEDADAVALQKRDL